MDTRDTVVQVHGVLRCAKVQYRTRTCGTHFGSTVGKPIPVRNPINIVPKLPFFVHMSMVG